MPLYALSHAAVGLLENRKHIPAQITYVNKKYMEMENMLVIYSKPFVDFIC